MNIGTDRTSDSVGAISNVLPAVRSVSSIVRVGICRIGSGCIVDIDATPGVLIVT